MSKLEARWWSRVIAVIIFLLEVVLVQPRLLAAQPQDNRGKNPASTSMTAPERQPSPGKHLTLEGAIRIGLTGHPLLDQARAAARGAGAVTTQAKGALYPWLEVSAAGTSGSLRVLSSDGGTLHTHGGLGFGLGGALPQHNQNMLTGGLILNQLVTDFGATAHRILASEATQAATEKELLTSKALVIFTIQKAYLGCLLQQRLVAIAAETVRRREAVRDLVDALYKSQLKSKVDVDLVLVQVSNAKLALIKAENDLVQAFAELNHAMGLDRPTRYDLAPVSLAVVSLPDLELLVDRGLKNRPEVLGTRHRLVASEEVLKAARALNLGLVSAVGTIGITKYGNVHDSGIPDSGVAPLWGAGATAALPLFTGFRIQNQINEASHRQGEAEQDLQELANDVVLQVIRSFLAQTTNAEQIVLEQQRVVLANEALELAQERYRLGLSPIIEVVRATTALFEAESRLAESQYIYKISEAAVAYATGQDYQRY